MDTKRHAHDERLRPAKNDRLLPTRIDLPAAARAKLVDLLNERLADVGDLATQAKQAHWNVKGPSFIALHELFDQVVAAAREFADLVAERAVQLGGVARGTARVIAAKSSLAEYPLGPASGRDHVEALSAAIAACGKRVREAIDEAEELEDQGTMDLLTQVSQGLDKYLWMVEAHAQAEE